MNTDYVNQWTELARKAQAPFRDLAELNAKTLQGLNWLNPGQLTSLNTPDKLMEEQINLAIENGHKALDYMQKSWQLVSRAMSSLADEIRE